MTNSFNYRAKKSLSLCLSIFVLIASSSFASSIDNLQEAIRQGSIEGIRKISMEEINLEDLYYFSELPSVEISKFLLENKKKPMDPDSFLKLIINVSTEDYNYEKRLFEVSNKLVAKQLELIKWILEEKGADPNKIEYFSSLPALELSQLLVENEKNPMSPSRFLGLIMRVSINEKVNPETGVSEVDSEQVAKRDGLIKWILEEKGADPNEITSFSNLPSIELSVLLLENGEGSIDSSYFLELVLKASCYKNVNGQHEIDEKAEKLQLKLVDLALSKEANPSNFQVISSILFRDYISLDVLELLFSNSYKEITSEDFHKIIEFLKKQIGDLPYDPLFIFEMRYKNLNAKEGSLPKIPRILYHIWLTNEEQKREISKEDVGNVVKTHEIFAKTGKGWKHIVWTNDRSLIPKSVEALEQNGIEVREIGALKETFKLGEKIDELISEGKWGMASDSLRYELLKRFGGIYADLNYIFARDVEKGIYRYDFFGQPGGEGGGLENFFFGAKPGHPIFDRVIDIVHENFYNPGMHIKGLKGRTVTDVVTYSPIFGAYYQGANNGTIDVIIPYIDFHSASGGHSGGFIRTASEKRFVREINKQKMRIIGKYIDHPGDLEFLDKVSALVGQDSDHEICGTSEQFFGQDKHGATTWLD